jgi:hypothetical protein
MNWRAIMGLVSSTAGATAQVQVPPAVVTVNAVGYVNTVLVPGLNLIANPLTNEAEGGNTLDHLFRAAEFPPGSRIYLPGASGFDVATSSSAGTGQRYWEPLELGTRTVEPGDGCFVDLAGTQNLTVTFVGTILQGVLQNHIPAGLSLQSSLVPQAGSSALLQFEPEPGDMIYKLDTASKKYRIFTFDDLTMEWLPSDPEFFVGEAFWLRTEVERDWVREFHVTAPLAEP